MAHSSLRILFAFFACLVLCSLLSFSALADTHVRGYYRKNGTYVAPHYRSSPNSTKLDNWSTKGNINPYTGKLGTKNVYGSPSFPAQKTYSFASSSTNPSLLNGFVTLPKTSSSNPSAKAPTKNKSPVNTDLEKTVYEQAKSGCRFDLTPSCIKRKMTNIYDLNALENEMAAKSTKTQGYYKQAKSECRFDLTSSCIKRKMENLAGLDALERSIYSK